MMEFVSSPHHRKQRFSLHVFRNNRKILQKTFISNQCNWPIGRLVINDFDVQENHR